MSDKTSEDLLNCPFCGGEAEVKAEPYYRAFVAWVTCKSCGASSKTGSGGLKKTAIEEAIAAWNHRKPMERILERLQEETVFFEDSYGDEVLGVPENIAIKIVKQEGGLND